MEFTLVVNQMAGIFTVLCQILAVALIISLFLKEPLLPKVILKNAFPIAFFVALIATLGSLIYSEIIGYEPCKLCWFQRIFLLPQVIILGMAWFKKDFKAASYAIVLSFIGAFIALYHYLVQFGVAPNIPCSATGPSCAQRFVQQYGYITIPMMSLSVFVLIIVLLYVHKRGSSNS